jgi:hypothetical protein
MGRDSKQSFRRSSSSIPECSEPYSPHPQTCPSIHGLSLFGIAQVQTSTRESFLFWCPCRVSLNRIRGSITFSDFHLLCSTQYQAFCTLSRLAIVSASVTIAIPRRQNLLSCSGGSGRDDLAACLCPACSGSRQGFYNLLPKKSRSPRILSKGIQSGSNRKRR